MLIRRSGDGPHRFFFPSLKDNSYRYEGQTYSMGQHGFARDMDFALTDQTEDKLEFTLSDNEETYEKYPFHFQLQIIYEIFQNQCRVTWKVKNMDEKTMYFRLADIRPLPVRVRAE